MFQIALSPSNQLAVILPTGRTVEIQASAQGLSFILKLLRDEKRGIVNQPGYIRSYPTQHAVDKFLTGKAIKEREAAAERIGVDLDKLEITL